MPIRRKYFNGQTLEMLLITFVSSIYWFKQQSLQFISHAFLLLYPCLDRRENATCTFQGFMLVFVVA